MNSGNTLEQVLSDECNKFTQTVVVVHCIPHFISFLEQWKEDGKTDIPTEDDLKKFFNVASYTPPARSAEGGSGKALKPEVEKRYRAILDDTHDYNYDPKGCCRYKVASDLFCGKTVIRNSRVCKDCANLKTTSKLIEMIEGDFNEKEYVAGLKKKAKDKAAKALGSADASDKPAPENKRPAIKKSNTTTTTTASDKKTTTTTTTTTATNNYVARVYKKGPAGQTCFWIKLDDVGIIFNDECELVGTAKTSITSMSEVNDACKKIFNKHIEGISKAIDKPVPKANTEKIATKPTFPEEEEEDEQPATKRPATKVPQGYKKKQVVEDEDEVVEQPAPKKTTKPPQGYNKKKAEEEEEVDDIEAVETDEDGDTAIDIDVDETEDEEEVETF